MTGVEISEVVSRFFTINGPARSSTPIKIHTLIHTPSTPSAYDQDAPSIINLHYWGGSASTFRHVPKFLHDRQVLDGADELGRSTVISISLRGWGQSSPATPDIPSAYSIHALASDVVNLLPQLKSAGLISQAAGYVLCGHSMGGKVALAMIQLLASSASILDLPTLHGILLLAPAPPTPLVLPDDMREQQIHAYESAESVEWTARNVLTGSAGERLYSGNDDLKMIIQDSLSGSPGAKTGWPGIAMDEAIDLPQFLHEDDRSKVKFRILVSTNDMVETPQRVVQETVTRLKSLGHNVHHRIIGSGTVDPDSHSGSETGSIGHLLPLEAPMIVAEELAELLHDVVTL